MRQWLVDYRGHPLLVLCYYFSWYRAVPSSLAALHHVLLLSPRQSHLRMERIGHSAWINVLITVRWALLRLFRVIMPTTGSSAASPVIIYNSADAEGVRLQST
jgi:hypothetical protein